MTTQGSKTGSQHDAIPGNNTEADTLPVFDFKNQLKQLASIDSDMAEVVRTAGFGKAAETIKTVNAQYGYKPERSRLRLQVGAVIAFLNFNKL